MTEPRPDLVALKHACYHCGHNQHEHNLIVGCPHCACAATPGEAGTDPTGKWVDQPLLQPGQYLKSWQRPVTVTEVAQPSEAHADLIEKITAIDYWGARSKGSARTTARRIVAMLEREGILPTAPAETKEASGG